MIPESLLIGFIATIGICATLWLLAEAQDAVSEEFRPEPPRNETPWGDIVELPCEHGEQP